MNTQEDAGLNQRRELLDNKRRLLALYREQKKQRGLSDLYFFGKYILGYKQMEEQPHREMCDFIQYPCNRKLLLEPRGSFKSTVGAITYPIWKIVQNPDIRILIDSEDLANSKKMLAAIKAQFEGNEVFRSLFGDLKGDKWTENEITVVGRKRIAREPTIATSGVETPRVGLHFDLIISDDLHSFTNVGTPELLEKVINHWRLNAAILEPGGEEIVIGTRWHMGDLYGTIIEQEIERRRIKLPKKFIVRKRAAEYDDGTLHFPTRLTKEFLEDQRIQLGSSLYALQYANNPIDEGVTKFKKHWIKFYGHYTPNNLIKTSTLDPAISQKDASCNTALVTCGTDEDGYIYILDCTAVKFDPKQVIDLMFETNDRWNMRELGIEAVTFQKVFKFWAWERMRQTGKFINIRELKTETDVSKDMRIQALIPYVESGTILFPGSGPESLTGGLRQLYDELIQYPVAKTKDCVDALAYQLQLYTPARVPTKKAEIKFTFQEIMKQERAKRVKVKGKLPRLGRLNVDSRVTSTLPVMVRYNAS